MLAAGIGGFLAPTQKSRTFTLEMEPYTAETKPEREFDDADVDDLNSVYIFLRHWAARANLDQNPAMPPGVLRRFADNVRGLLAIADSCGEEWGRRAREAVTALLEKERRERPQTIIIRHRLLIFDIYELDQISSLRFNKELQRLDLPDARWTQYRGASGADYLHPLRMDEQAELLQQVGIASEVCWPAEPRQPGPAFVATSAPPSRRRDASTMWQRRKRPSCGASVSAWSAPPISPSQPSHPSQGVTAVTCENGTSTKATEHRSASRTRRSCVV